MRDELRCLYVCVTFELVQFPGICIFCVRFLRVVWQVLSVQLPPNASSFQYVINEVL